MTAKFDTIKVTGAIECPADAISAQNRATALIQEDLARFPILWEALRVWDAYATNLPGTAAADDLALVGGTFGTNPPRVQAGDLKAAGATDRYARFAARLPECYVAGQTVNLVISAGMLTTVADVSCTVDVECYQVDKAGGISADLCATAAQTINNLTPAEKSFAITPTALEPGDLLDVRIKIACNDAATATAVTPSIASIDLACDIKG